MARTTVPRTAGAPTRDLLLTSARRILVEDGVEGVGLRAIARGAGVSHSAPLRHFSGLDSLLSALAAEGFVELHASIERSVAEQGPAASALDRLRAAGRGYVRMALEDPGVFAIMFRPDLIDAGDQICVEAGLVAFAQLVDHVADAQAEGWRSDADTGDLAVVTWAIVHGLCELWLHGPIGTDPRGIDVFVDLALQSHIPVPTIHPTEE